MIILLPDLQQKKSKLNNNNNDLLGDLKKIDDIINDKDK